MSKTDHQPPKNVPQQMQELLRALLSISRKADTVEMAREAGKQIVHFLNVDGCGISRWNEADNTFQLWSEYSRTDQTAKMEWFEPYSLDDYPLSKWVIENAKPAQVRMDDPKGDPAEKELMKKFRNQSLLMLPLMAGDRVIGLVEIMDNENLRTFNEDEIVMGQLLSNHIGGLIDKNRLLEETDLRANELDAVRHASLSLTSNTSLNDVLNEILESVMLLFDDVSNNHVFLYDGDKLTFGAALWSDGRKTGPFAEPRQGGLTHTVARSGEMIAVPDITKHPLFKDAPNDWAGSIIGLPLKTGDRVIGVMNIAFQNQREFTEHIYRVLGLFGDQAAVAIERARGVQMVKDRAEELEALRQASLSLTASLALEDVLENIVDSALKLTQNALDAHIFLFDGQELTFGTALWSDGEEHEPYSSVRENGLTYTVAHLGEMIAIPNIRKSELFAETQWKDDWNGAIVGLPLKFGERVVGVLNVAYQAPRDFHENTLRVLGLMADQAALAIENAKLHNLVKEQALTDPLTGLANRRAFELRLEEEIRRSNRYNHPFSIIMMDLNGFKRVNDTYGHPVGDQTLVDIGKGIQKAVRDTDLLVRMGGDEFLLLLPETKEKDAEKIGAKVADMVKAYPFSWKKKGKTNLELTLSFGVACYPEHAKSGADLIQIADTLLYQHKKEPSR